MDNAPDRIWAWKTPEGKEQWYDSICHWMWVGAVEYVRADLASPLVAECGHPFCGMKCGEPTDADLDRDALDRPKVRALVDAAMCLIRDHDADGRVSVNSGMLRSVRAALAALEASHE